MYFGIWCCDGHSKEKAETVDNGTEKLGGGWMEGSLLILIDFLFPFCVPFPFSFLFPFPFLLYQNLT